ncbi:hypothetical protein C7121_10500 [Paenibacillus glucanolyticus]|nr:hypothetical protein A3958_05800 [Paenibacillus glucanolyticus]AVV56522.1 hypothetical protein C7121_10500 [Paenibacillus glucanolyticus]MPY19724.1 hypothetical protein [Paenibacillus glucanolyticus]
MTRLIHLHLKLKFLLVKPEHTQVDRQITALQQLKKLLQRQISQTLSKRAGLRSAIHKKQPELNSAKM